MSRAPGQSIIYGCLAHPPVHDRRMSEAASFIERHTPASIAAVVGVHVNAVGNAKREGVMPARWYVPLLEAGLDPPIGAFRWHRATHHGEKA